MRLPGHERSASRARTFVAGLLGDAHPLADTACLIVSELVTNAILHSRSRLPGGMVSVTLSETRTCLTIEVTDAGSPKVPVRRSESTEISGRGLLLVSALSDAWGYRHHESSTTVWCRLRG